MQEVGLIVPPSQIQLSLEEKRSLTQRLSPYAAKARETRNNIKSKQELQQEEETLLKHFDDRDLTSDQAEQLAARLISIRESKRDLKSDIKSLEETWRFQTNNVIKLVNEAKCQKALSLGVVTPLTVTSVKRIPQIEAKRPTISVPVPKSPTRQHNDLNPEVLFRRDMNPNSPLVKTIRQKALTQNPGNKDRAVLAATVANHLPNHIITRTIYSTPEYFQNHSQVAAGVLALTDKLVAFNEGTYLPPSALELGQTSKDQEKHIQRYVEFVLLNCLKQELVTPNVTEFEVNNKFYKDMNKRLREGAEWLGYTGYERVSKAIGSLTDVEAAMIGARLSNNMDRDLEFPTLCYSSERRVAEILKNAAFDRHSDLACIFEVISDRLDQGDINPNLVVSELMSVKYRRFILEALAIRSVEDEELSSRFGSLVYFGLDGNISKANGSLDYYRSMSRKLMLGRCDEVIEMIPDYDRKAKRLTITHN